MKSGVASRKTPSHDRCAAGGRPQPSRRARGRGQARRRRTGRTPTRPKTSAVSPTPRSVEEDERKAEAARQAPRGPDRDQGSAPDATRATRRLCGRSTRSSATRSPSPTLRCPRGSRRTSGFPALRKKAASASSPEERLSAERILANLRAQTGFYLPEEMLDQRDTARGARPAAGPGRDRPGQPARLLQRRRPTPRVRATRRGRSRTSSTRSRRDSQRFELIDEDTDFDPIRQDDAFRKWLASGPGRRPVRALDGSALRSGDPDQTADARALPELPDEERDEDPRADAAAAA